MRAFAALWVVLFHLRLAPARALEWPSWFAWFAECGYLGVDLFGLLSGFVITHNYVERLSRRDAATAGRYLWIRAVRIVPLHWFALAVMVAARCAPGGFDEGASLYETGDLVQQLLLVHGWGIGRWAWNIPSWTVSCEWLCYLLFPLVAPWLARLRAGRPALLLAVTVLIATIAAMRLVGRPGFNATTDWGMARIGGEFLMGCLLQRAFAVGYARTLSWGIVGPLAIAAAALASLVPSAPAMVACFAVLVFALAHQQGWLARFLSTRPVVFLGEASYAIYIMHYVVLRMFGNWLPGPGWGGSQAGRVAVEFVAVVGVAIAVHLAIENPARRRLRRWVAPV